jgi:SET domain-containing protein
MDYENELISITVVKDVKKGDELFINYNASPDSQKPVWFDAK